MTLIQQMRERWGIADALPVADDQRLPGNYVSTFHFAEVIGQLLKDGDVLATGCSGLATEIFQLAVPLASDRDIICSWSLGAMGFGIPTAIGACIGSDYKNTVCVDGDGGFQLNIQDLATVRGMNLPIKFFVLDNNGYASMRVSQQRWFGRTFGTDDNDGLHMPNLERVVEGYDIPFVRIDGWRDLRQQVRAVLNMDGPVVCDVPSPPDEQRPSQAPKTTAWSPVTRIRDWGGK